MRHRLIERAVVDRPWSGWFAMSDHRPSRHHCSRQDVARGMPTKLSDKKLVL